MPGLGLIPPFLSRSASFRPLRTLVSDIFHTHGSFSTPAAKTELDSVMQSFLERHGGSEGMYDLIPEALKPVPPEHYCCQKYVASTGNGVTLSAFGFVPAQVFHADRVPDAYKNRFFVDLPGGYRLYPTGTDVHRHWTDCASHMVAGSTASALSEYHYETTSLHSPDFLQVVKQFEREVGDGHAFSPRDPNTHQLLHFDPAPSPDTPPVTLHPYAHDLGENTPDRPHQGPSANEAIFSLSSQEMEASAAMLKRGFDRWVDRVGPRVAENRIGEAIHQRRALDGQNDPSVRMTAEVGGGR